LYKAQDFEDNPYFSFITMHPYSVIG